MDIGKFEIPVMDEKIKEIVYHLTNENNAEIRQVCERYGEEPDDIRYYDVYIITFPSCKKVLKKVGKREKLNYETYLSGNDFAVPHYYGKWIAGDEYWILIEYIAGHDLRDMTDQLALSAADTLSRIQNAYWQDGEAAFKKQKTDDRFDIYWARIQRRATSIEQEPELWNAYQLFLDRQLTCPRTLSNGDFLQFNVVNSNGKVYVIDWGFGGIMPYSLDIARFIAHATEGRSTFPFYMNDRQKQIFCDRMYEKIQNKPSYPQFIRDIQLATLNEYIEFVEAEEDPDGWYHNHALQLACKLLNEPC